MIVEMMWWCWLISTPPQLYEIEFDYPPINLEELQCPDEEWDQRELNPHLLTENAF